MVCNRQRNQRGYHNVYLCKCLENIGRNKGRNILMGIIILVTITVSIVSLCINNTTTSIIDDYKSRFGSEVTIIPDMTKVMSMSDLLSERALKLNKQHRSNI